MRTLFVSNCNLHGRETYTLCDECDHDASSHVPTSAAAATCWSESRCWECLELGVPYHRAVEGPDGRYWWAKCPRCGEVVEDKDGLGAARHWGRQHRPDSDGCPSCGRGIDRLGGNPDCETCAAEPPLIIAIDVEPDGSAHLADR